MRYIDVCSGISAPTAAWKPLGWQALCYAEIEAAPRAVLAHHYPDVPLVGDFTQIEGTEYGPVDLLVGGTPCQSFSIAGLRGGLADERGNLALEYLRLAHRSRARWLVWENVPGVLSIDGGRAFGAILGGMAELGYGFAYRVLDAQHFGVPQRRRRVFVVGYLGDWRRAAAVLFERHGLSWHPAPRRGAREGTAGVIARSVAIRGRDGTPQAELGDELANAILTPNGGRAGVGCGAALIEPVSATVSSKWAKGSGGPSGDECQNLLPVPVAFSTQQTPKGWDVELGTCPTLQVPSKSGGGQPHAVAFMENQQGAVWEANCFQALNKGGGKPGQSYPALRQGSAVRRLTPRECERLQGFPETQNCYILRVWQNCSDHQKSNAHAALLNLRSQSSASPAAESGSTQFANAADEQSNTLLLGLVSRAAVSVQIDLERGAVRILSPEKSISSVEGAEDRNLFPLPTGIDSFARLVVLLTRAWEMATRVGRAESQASIRHSIPAWIGSGIAPLSGQEIAGRAGDVEKWLSIAKRLSMSTISDAGQISPDFGSILETLSCSVAHAIAGCIPPRTPEANFYDIALTTSCGFTAVPYRGRMMADGPRYKMLGNSMAVPVMRWIGERIAMVDALYAEGLAA